MVTLYRESIIDAWDYWCSFQIVKRNRNNGSEVIIDEGVYSPVTTGMLRVGEKVSYLDSTYDIIERTAIALKPDLSRFNIDDLPSSLNLMIYLSLVVLSTGESSLLMTSKPWANSSASSWTLDTEITYEDIVDHYVPFDETSLTYLAATYEVTNTLYSTSTSSYFKNITNNFISFIEEDSSGILITATGGYADVFGPGYSTISVRPYIKTVQVITERVSSFLTMSIEIASESKVKGVCRDREGNIITGRSCRIIIFDRSSYKILGTGESVSATGKFFVDASCKAGELVMVSFVDTSGNIAGSELMMTISKNSTSA